MHRDRLGNLKDFQSFVLALRSLCSSFYMFDSILYGQQGFTDCLKSFFSVERSSYFYVKRLSFGLDSNDW